MKVTAQLKKSELARGAQLLDYISGLKTEYIFNRVSLNHFEIMYEGKATGHIVWRLGQDGTGKIQWKPSEEYKDIAPRRESFCYDYTDNVSDAQSFVDWLTPIFQDIEA